MYPMKLRIPVLVAGILLAFHTVQAGEIQWQPWSDSVFAEAKQEGRFVLLDLGTGWCHWCHVMEAVTYKDPAVIELIRKRYVAVRVDADSRPDLSNRYEDYGWPATIVFNGDGGEIVKRQGYIPPKPMASMLQAVIDDPTPGPSVLPEQKLSVSPDAFLTADARKNLRQVLVNTYDPKNKGWGTVQKFLNWDVIEYCMVQAKQGDTKFEEMGRETLAAQLQLIDPVWGGACQYSTDGDWKHPHFEKIMQMQAENLRTYATAYALWRDPTYLQTAKRLRSYLKNFLTSPEGGFFASQDADLVPGKHAAEYFRLSDSERRKRGVPKVDQHIYSRENGWAINALTSLYAVTGDDTCLADAIEAANWIIAHRSLTNGGFEHDQVDPGGHYLGDTLYMGRAFLALYAVTADRTWLQRAEQTAQFISTNFKNEIGYVTSANIGALKSNPQVDENADLVRLANLLHHYTGKTEYKEMAEHAMQYLSVPAAADGRGFLVGGILLADLEMTAPPRHITIVGRKDDATARELFLAALQDPSTYKRIEWWDEREGALPNGDVEYPTLEQAAAFVCGDKSCSAPIFSPEKLTGLSQKRAAR
jgi:uncharacterized protein YyaL (SSP411 family)